MIEIVRLTRRDADMCILPGRERETKSKLKTIVYFSRVEDSLFNEVGAEEYKTIISGQPRSKGTLTWERTRTRHRT